MLRAAYFVDRKTLRQELALVDYVEVAFNCIVG